MARYKNLAPYPGTQLADLRIVKPGVEFIVPDDTPARELWLPLDAAAHAAVERAKLAVTETVKQQEAELRRQGTPQRRVFKTAEDRTQTPSEPGERPEDKRVERDEAVLHPSQARKTL